MLKDKKKEIQIRQEVNYHKGAGRKKCSYWFGVDVRAGINH